MLSPPFGCVIYRGDAETGEECPQCPALTPQHSRKTLNASLSKQHHVKLLNRHYLGMHGARLIVQGLCLTDKPKKERLS